MRILAKLVCAVIGHRWRRRVFFVSVGCDDDAPAPVEIFCTRCKKEQR